MKIVAALTIGVLTCYAVKTISDTFISGAIWMSLWATIIYPSIVQNKKPFHLDDNS